MFRAAKPACYHFCVQHLTGGKWTTGQMMLRREINSPASYAAAEKLIVDLVGTKDFVLVSLSRLS